MGNTKQHYFSSLIIGTLSWLALTGCGNGTWTISGSAAVTVPAAGGDDGSDGTDLTEENTSVPALVITSPFSDTTDVNAFNPATEQTSIDNNFNGTTCSINMNSFNRNEGRPPCFGPSIQYQNHPDGGGASGQLPGGDLGLWLPTHTDGSSCGTTVVNERMGTAAWRTNAVRQITSAIGCVIAKAGIIPEEATPVDATDLINALETPEVDFTLATLTHTTQPGGTLRKTYEVNFTYQGKPISMDVNYEPGETAGDEVGLLAIKVDKSGDGGTCGGGTYTRNHSIAYEIAGNATHFEMRSADACGSQVDLIDDNGIVGTASAWAKNYNLFSADFDKRTFAGDYNVSWQAGVGDSHSRVLAVHADDDGTRTISGAVFFGYGLPISANDNNPTGMICNWAGPGNQHTPQPFLQFQSVVRDTNNKFVPDDSRITYAPKNSCSYAGAGTFIWDRNADNSLVDENGATPQANGLQSAFDLNGDNVPTVLERLQQEGYAKPQAPAPFF